MRQGSTSQPTGPGAHARGPSVLASEALGRARGRRRDGVPGAKGDAGRAGWWARGGVTRVENMKESGRPQAQALEMLDPVSGLGRPEHRREWIWALPRRGGIVV